MISNQLFSIISDNYWKFIFHPVKKINIQTTDCDRWILGGKIAVYQKDGKVLLVCVKMLF